MLHFIEKPLGTFYDVFYDVTVTSRGSGNIIGPRHTQAVPCGCDSVFTCVHETLCRFHARTVVSLEISV